MRSYRTVQLILTAAVLFLSTLAHADDRNLQPKYGSLPKEQWQVEADNAFLRATDEEYHGDREKASRDTAMRGWQFLQQGDFDTAMRRFNQAWLLNAKNGIALWGMAAIEASAGKFDESIKLFAEAEPLVVNEVNFSVDYAKAIGMMGVERKDKALIKDALDRFEAIYKQAPQNTNNLQNWAITLFGIERYSEAWEKMKLAEATPNKQLIDKEFVAALQAKMPRPK